MLSDATLKVSHMYSDTENKGDLSRFTKNMIISIHRTEI